MGREQDPGTLDSAPGQGSDAITPADSDLAYPYRSVYVGTGGADKNVKITGVDGSICVWKNVPTGFVIPVAVKRVWSTLTTASDLVGIR